MPISTDYVIGPGDEIKILMWGRIDESSSVEVAENGMVVLPKVGPVAVTGLTFGQIEDLIKTKVGAISGVKVSVSMGKLRNIQVFVLGEVKNPGIYTMGALSTVANAIHNSGGPTSLGTMRKAELRRRDITVARLDFYDLLLKGDIAPDKMLMDGDVIFVPQTGPMVSVSGDVRRPAIYELKGDRTLKTAFELAGGLKPTAYNQRIQIKRALENRAQIVLDISSKEIQGKRRIPLKDGDLIRVFRILSFPVNAVYLYGNVLRPGKYAYRKGFRVLDILPNMSSVDRDTCLDYAIIKRYSSEDMEAKLISFNLGRLLLSGDETQNIPLRPTDEIYVFNKQRFEDKKYATIKGEVNKPGRYDLTKEMTLKNLIFSAGGLARGAYMKRAEVIRYNVVAGEKVETSVFSFNVGLAIKGDPAHNKRLQPMDVVYIKEIPEWDKREMSVIVSGEVYFPGTYQLLPDDCLSDVVERAGGYTGDAYLRGAVFTRESVRKLQQQQLDEMIKRLEIEIASLSSLEGQAVVTEKDVISHAYFISAKKSLLAKLRERKLSGRVVISLQSVGESKKGSDDFALEDGDSLYVPKEPDTINVLGAVYNPMAYAYDKKHPGIAYYLDKTGGPAENAEAKQIYVIRADGTVVSKQSRRSAFDKTVLFPGDTIMVPYKGILPGYRSVVAR